MQTRKCESLKYFFSWLWLHGNLPPISYVGDKKIQLVMFPLYKMFWFLINKKPEFIPANDVKYNGWFGLKRLLMKKYANEKM